MGKCQIGSKQLEPVWSNIVAVQTGKSKEDRYTYIIVA